MSTQTLLWTFFMYSSSKCLGDFYILGDFPLGTVMSYVSY